MKINVWNAINKNIFNNMYARICAINMDIMLIITNVINVIKIVRLVMEIWQAIVFRVMNMENCLRNSVFTSIV